ncbi:putative endoplasmic reticulum metallopeptidase 1-like isoform X1 [Capsicum annuum]|nr:putative endoplasmic reticulum metallopeptidase 1-like isoform X1 [Capsicum annuum]
MGSKAVRRSESGKIASVRTATREPEVGIASNHGSDAAVNMHPGPVHTARHTLDCLCRASQVAEFFPTISPEVYVREARVEDCWEVAETHCSSFFPEYSFPLDFVSRIDRLIAMLFGFSIPNGCQRTCLVAVVGSKDEEACLLSTEELKLGGFDGRLSLNKGYVTGILTVDTVADFLPRKGPLRQRSVLQGGFLVTSVDITCVDNNLRNGGCLGIPVPLRSRKNLMLFV